jgi:hypothetical protein
LNVFKSLSADPAHGASVVSAARLYVRCLAWGLATGTAVGGLVGLLAGILMAASAGPALAAVALVTGVVYGALFAVVPTVVGGLVVVVVLIRRHPRPASADEVHRDLGVVFASVVVALDLVVLVPWLVLGGLTMQLLAVLGALLLVDVAAAAVLKPARTSITRAWVGGSDGARVATVTRH